MPDVVEKLVSSTPHYKTYFGKAEKWPGWTWLAFVVYLAETQLPDRVTLFGSEYDLSKRPSVVIVAGVTLMLYVLGDFLNDVVWKRRGSPGDEDEDRFTYEGLSAVRQRGVVMRALWWVLGITSGIKKVSVARRLAQEWIGVAKGSYRVALRIAEAAEDELRGGVHWPNELAKTVRSLAIPLVVAGIVMAVVNESWWHTLISLLGLVCFRMYLGLKFMHIGRLYVAVNALETSKRLTISTVPTDRGQRHRTFLVGTKMVGVVLPPAKQEDALRGSEGSHPSTVRSSDAAYASAMTDRRAKHRIGEAE